MNNVTLPPTEYVFTISEIVELLGISQQAIDDKKKLFNWQPTGERTQGGGDKYNINTIRFYKSDEKHQEALSVIKNACELKKYQAQIAAAAELKARYESETLAVVQSTVAHCKRYLPDELLKREVEIKSQVKLLKDSEGMERDQQALVLLAMANDRAKHEGTAKKWVLDDCQAYLKANNYQSKHLKKNPKGWNEKGIEAYCRDFIAGRIEIPSEFRASFVQAGKLSLTKVTIRAYKKAFDEFGFYGLIDKHKPKKGLTKLTQPQQDFIIGMIVDFPHVHHEQIREGMSVRFPGEYIPHVQTIGRFVDYWKEENPSRYLLLSNPDKHKNKYQFAAGKADEYITRLNQVWEADSTPADILCIDGRCSILGIIDVWPRRVKLLASPTSKGTAIRTLKRRCMLEWGIEEEFHTDCGADYTGNLIEAVCERLNIYHHTCPPFTPESKPFIERVFKTLSHGLMELLPGYIGHSVSDRKDIESRKSFANRLMKQGGDPIEINMTMAELQTFLDNWTTIYHNKRHSSLKMSPAAKVRSWTEPIRKITNERALDVLLSESVWRVVSKKGISVTFKGASMQYLAGEFSGYEGKRVEVFIDETDLGHAVIFSEEKQFICVAQDPAWLGISLQEVAVEMKRKQKENNSETKKELKRISRAANTKNIAHEIIKNRVDAANKITDFPKKTEQYGTESLMEAATAVNERERKNEEPRGTALTANQIRNSDELLNQTPQKKPLTMLDRALEYERKIKEGTATAAEIEYVEAYQFYEDTGRRTGPLVLKIAA